ncbi:ketopantoate reductase family protein [Proteocatella sphenisci]|uniref:ketopantoate reductase family protein n=1 Tax=Proteocatella sphenisci TaxID=181070 RepID=UPI000491DF4E|nr:2-dehydropantoate 2-reductase [Proteocatella sphenisci]
MEIKKVVIVGRGALGILFGYHFTEKMGKSAVSFIASDDRIKKYNQEVSLCNGKVCDFSYISEDLKGEPADLVIFAVKSTRLEEALETAKNQIGDNTTIISVLNGISSEKIISDRYGKERIIHCVAQGMDAVKLGNDLSYSKMGELIVGIQSEDKQKRERLDSLCDFFEKVQLPYTREKDIIHRMWSKFMLNVGVNQVVMVNEGTYKTIQSPGEPRYMMIGAMREVVKLSEYEGANVTEKELQDYLSIVDSLDPENMPSMRQDGIEKRKSEVELFSGTVINLSKEHSVESPVNELLYKKIKEIESTY